MHAYLVSNPGNNSSSVQKLRGKLDEFYRDTTTYSAFTEAPDNSASFELLKPYINELLQENPQIRVLELGAGLPTFPDFFRDVRSRIDYHVQDVTPQNQAHLQRVADTVHIGDVSQIEAQFDLVFSLYVFEHVATPNAFLREVERLLKPGGIHFVVCPRYDLPGYLCPSLRHLNTGARFSVLLRLAASRVGARLTRRPRFWVNCDPAVFHGSWFRDADAVHLVSRLDVDEWHRRHGFEVDSLGQSAVWRGGWRNAVVKKYATLAAAYRKPKERV